MNSQKTMRAAIIGKALTFSLAICLAGSATLFTNTAHADDLAVNVDFGQDSSSLYSVDDLDNLLAPIALYPDLLLAQILVATTFDDQIQDASQVLSAGPVAIDGQPWDDSVKAVAHYPKVLFILAAQPDWSSAIGQAYVTQSTDVMNSIQRLRAMALSQGNLVSTQQQQVGVMGSAIQILPARAGYIFLPSYDPTLAFSTPAFISFGPALAIDASCDDHIDWHEHHIFDHHLHYAKTGDRGRRGRINRVRGPRGRYNPGVTKTRTTKPGTVKTGTTKTRTTKPATTTTGTTKTGTTKTGTTKSVANKSGNTRSGSTKVAAAKPGTIKSGTIKTAAAKSGTTRGSINGGRRSDAGVNRAQMNRGQVNRNQSNPGANRGQVNRAPATIAMNRSSAGPRASGRSGHR
jgi:hypothetical protein